MQSRRIEDGTGSRQWRPHALVAVVAVIASAAGLLNDFVYDDIPIIRDNARLHGLAHWREIITRPYWPPPFVEQLFRPLSSFVLAIEYALGGGSPLVFRLVSCALYAASAVAVFKLASRMPWSMGSDSIESRLNSSLTPFAVAVLFAAHPVHVEAVALGVNQSELLVGLIASVTVCFYIDRRRAGTVRPRDWLIVALLYAAAALSKESGFVLPGLLLAAELVVADAAPRLGRARRLWPGYFLLALVGIGVGLARGAVLGNHVVGAVPAEAFDGLSLGGRMVMMLQVVPMWLRLLVWPAHLQADYAPGEIVSPSTLGAPEIEGLTLLLLAAVVAIIAWRRAPLVSFGLLWCAIGLLPVSNIVPTGIVLAERTLFLPSIGLLIAAGGVAERLLRTTQLSTGTMRRALVGGCVGLAALGVARSASRQRVWNTAHLRIVTRPNLRTDERAGERHGGGQRGR